MQQQTNKSAGYSSLSLLTTISFFVLLAGAFSVAVTHQRAIADFIQLRNYHAPATINAIATADTMTPKSRHIFYVNHPDINDKASFAKFCPSGTKEQTIVLGCYQSDQAGIFLLNVTDKRLNGVKEVTAAHEMLHAAYDRLSNKQRNDINAQLMAFYANGLTDERIKSTIDAYKKTEPKDVVNEMHSIFGTEVATLPPALEQYYKQYFINRSAVITLSSRYQSEFTTRKNQLAVDDLNLLSLKQKIELTENVLKIKQSDISAMQQRLLGLRSSNVEAYNAGVAPYNAAVNDYNAQVQIVRDLVAQYNDLVSQRNAIAVEEDSLVKSLSADTQTINN
jgi:hypothetical protein